jgi:DNA-binding NarL/FixJ family response regulator
MMTGKVRIILADDHPVVLAGLGSLIERDPGVELIGEATTGLAALALIREKQPDIAVADISMPGLSGIALAKRLAAECPSVRIVLLTVHEDRSYVNQALEAGVRGYALKRSAAENLGHAIRAVSAGGLYVDPAIADQVLDSGRRHNRRTSSGGPELSGREAEILKRTALGQSNKEISRHLDVSVKSVETYKSRGAEKLGLATRADIVRYASQQGWLTGI